ncbi:flagellar hook assembly protein FlgD [Pseudohalioglobus lutimaris]|uniref:Basal-body rod modification protein FlgD n=1 Tax=Pseudohalioglobus lutimaris TaxID=1737061 RepID=A0A2N5X1P7_9GAMM|nr:flagellar hook assembly protein FlgD [Pseudohalioglobus lutimaris]PLW68415.1 flagellar biosynthesis protein FlgD [Pseudohalioglobus lutimaris]
MQSTSALSELFPTPAAKTATNDASELGQDDFMELMVAQLENQDPTKPMDNFEFLSQIAQFGTVNGIQGLQDSFSEMTTRMQASQVVGAAALVGSKVLTETNIGMLDGENALEATVSVPGDSAGVQLYVQDMSGRLLHTRELGSRPSGEYKVQWDGADGDGNLLPPGAYRVSAEALIGGQTRALSVHTHALVESVNVDPSTQGVQLNLAGGEQVSLSSVKAFL